ncbi:hypothetical protein J4440_03875 [Candidatus Woesearchaeota archaeon]|nr:hypothetical protein [Candidatus Woesearchaeota archaeon]
MSIEQKVTLEEHTNPDRISLPRYSVRNQNHGIIDRGVIGHETTFQFDYVVEFKSKIAGSNYILMDGESQFDVIDIERRNYAQEKLYNRALFYAKSLSKSEGTELVILKSKPVKNPVPVFGKFIDKTVLENGKYVKIRTPLF